MTSSTHYSSTDTESGFFRRLFGIKSIKQAISRLCRPFRDRHDKHYRDNYFHLWADLLLVSIIISLVILVIWLFFWQPKPAFSLEIKSTSPEILSGQVEKFIIEYKNNEEETVSNLEITLVFPENFIFISAEPAEKYNSVNNTFILGELSSHDQGELFIEGIVRGERSDRQVLEADVKYQYKGKNIKFFNPFIYELKGSVLDVQISLPEQVYSDNNFNGDLEIKNTGSHTLSDMYITFPSLDYEVDTATGYNNGELYISKISPGEIKKIELDILPKLTGSSLFSLVTNFKIDNQYIPQVNITKNIDVIKPQLIAKARVSPVVVNAAGSKTSLIIDLTNLESQNLSEVTLTVVPRRNEVVIKNLFSQSDNVAVRGRSLYLGDIAARQQKTILADLDLQRSIVIVNDNVKINLEVSFVLNEQKYSYVTSTGNILFSSNLNIESGGYYYGSQGDQLGVGPIPPRVDIPTTYWIIWQVNNLGNDLDAVQVTADLPANIVWGNQQSISAGTLEYSPITRRVLWQPGEIDKNGGNYRASFAVSLVPQEADIGTVPVLLKNISYKGSDLYSKATLGGNLPEITADIQTDDLSSGKGIVVPLE